MTIKVKIILDLEQGEVELTKEEARQVYETLRPFFEETKSPPLNPLFQYPPGIRGPYVFGPTTGIDNGNPLTGFRSLTDPSFQLQKTSMDPIFPFGTK